MPSHFSMWKKRALRLEDISYQLVHRVLYRKQHNGIFLKCLEAQDSERCYMISMIEQSGDTSRVTKQCTRLYGQVYIDLHYSRMHTRCLQVFGLSKTRRQKSKVTSPAAAYCSGRNIPKVGLGYHQGYFPTFIKATSLYFDCHRLLHAVDKIRFAETSERSGSHQLPTRECHLQVWCPYITYFWQCNVHFFVKDLWLWVGKWYCQIYKQEPHSHHKKYHLL